MSANDEIFLDSLSPSPQPTYPPLDPFVTSLDIQVLRSYAWSFKSNSRALENHYLPVYRETLRELLAPLQGLPHQRRIVAGQQYLWCGSSRPDEKKRPRRKKSEKDLSPDSDSQQSEEEEEEEEEEGEEVEERDQVRAGKQEENDSDSDVASIAASGGSFNAVKDSKYSEGKPDVTTLRVELTQMLAPATLSLHGTALEDKQQKRELSMYIDNGGMALVACTPDSHTELKRAPRRFRSKRRFDSLRAQGEFFLDLDKQLTKASNQMVKYAVIFFQEHKEVDEFLAIIGSGPFWRYAIVSRDDCPWTFEKGSMLSRVEENYRLREFFKIFGSDIYFEIGTERSDAEWNAIRRVFFLGEPGQIGHRPQAREAAQAAAPAVPQAQRSTRASEIHVLAVAGGST